MKLSLFIVFACIGVTTNYMTFKYRYGWYTTDDQAIFLNLGFFILFGVIITSWAVFPSRTAVIIASASTAIFPWVLMPEKFPPIDLPFAAISLIPISLLALATHYRLELGRQGVRAS